MRISIWLNPTGCISVIYGVVFPTSPHRAASYRTPYRTAPYRKKNSHREKKSCYFLPGNFYKAYRMRMIRLICTITGYRSGWKCKFRLGTQRRFHGFVWVPKRSLHFRTAGQGSARLIRTWYVLIEHYILYH